VVLAEGSDGADRQQVAGADQGVDLGDPGEQPLGHRGASRPAAGWTWTSSGTPSSTSASFRSPPRTAPSIFSGGLGSGTFVFASTTQAEASIKFLGYLVTPEHRRWAAEKLQDLPAYPIDTNGTTASPLFTQVLDDSAKIADGAGDFGYKIDVLTTDVFNNAMWRGIQGILSGQGDAAKVAAQLQSAYEKSAK
jgi:ABC-type glycerol-3-phosphate transport system substrate-binding protein